MMKTEPLYRFYRIRDLQINDKDVTYRIADNGWDMYNKSDIRVVSGSFLRCRSMSIRYDFKT